MFLQGKAETIPDAFILAEQFVYHFENVVIKKEEERLKNKPTL
jgi:hypothetical protein